MKFSNKQILAYGWLCAAILGIAACAPRRVPPMTVSDLMEDRVTLDGVLLKCNQNPTKARTSSDCLNAWIAIERLAQEKEVDPSLERKRQEEFERSRERLRLAQEKKREAEEAKSKVDPYSLPVVPDPTSPPPANKADSPPIAGTH